MTTTSIINKHQHRSPQSSSQELKIFIFSLQFRHHLEGPKIYLTMAAATRKELLAKVHKMVPPMLESFHKGQRKPFGTLRIECEANMSCIIGQLGRVGVIGGSEDYTGAPYFSAMASAKLGCDMVTYSLFLSIRHSLLFFFGHDIIVYHPFQ
jgi:hypothetical protein